MFTKQFRITNLDCHSCVTLSVEVLKEIPGVTDAKVDLKSGAAEISAERAIEWELIRKALKDVGKNAEEVMNT